MKTNKQRPHAELIKAWADGAEIQYLYDDLRMWWQDIDNPVWDEKSEYREKPVEKWEPKASSYGGMQRLLFNRLTAWMQEYSTIKNYKIETDAEENWVAFIYFAPSADIKKLQQLIDDEIIIL